MNRRTIDMVGELPFDNHENAVIIGGAVLEIAGIRPADDVDIVTTRANVANLFEREPERWRCIEHRFATSAGNPFSLISIADEAGMFDIWYHAYDLSRPRGNRHVRVAELKETGWQDEPTGLFVASLNDVARMKWHAARSKDITDVELLRAHQIALKQR